MQPDPDSPVLIGVDVGTTSTRAIAFDVRGRQLAAGLRPTPTRVVPTGGEYDPDAVFAAVSGALADVGRALAGRPVAGIAVASIGESCVLVDEHGTPLAPSIVWHDRRTAAEARAVVGAVGAERIFAVSGHSAEPIFTLTKLIWMRTHWPDAMRRARRMLMMADWVAYRLCGAMATDPSLASRTLCYDIRGRCWSADMLALAGLDTDFPAPLAAGGTALGPVHPAILAGTGIAGRPVVGVGGHDHVLGACATGLIRPGTVVNSIGTAEALLLATAAPLDDPETLRRGYIQGAVAADRFMYYLGGSLFAAGRSLAWVRALTGGAPHETLMAEAAAVPAGSSGVVFLPHLANGPPPEPDVDARGAFLGLTAAADRGTLYRAVLEGIALQSRLMLDGMTALRGVSPPAEIRLIGGVSRNPLFLAIKANAFGRPIVLVEEAEGTALGAALFGGLAAGVYPGLEAAVSGLDRAERVIAPDGDLPAYDALRTMVFARLHDRLRPINRDLAGFRSRPETGAD